MTTQEKLKQIQTGSKNKRTTYGGEKKNIVITGKDGSKIIQSQKEEKFEETAVLRKKKNYVLYEAKLGTETTTDITKINAQKPKQKPKTREIEPRQEERIVQTKKKKEYLDNYQYHETKNIKNPNPRFQVIVEHKKLGDIIGGTFEETSYERTVFNQGSNRPQITEKTTTTTKTGSAAGPAAPQTTSKRNTTTTTTKTEQKGGAPKTATRKKEIISETSTKRRNEGTGSKTETRTEKKTTTSGTRGGQTGSSTTTKTTTRTTYQNQLKPKLNHQIQQPPTTTKTTTTRTTKTAGGDSGKKTQTTVTKTESTEGGAGSSSIRKKYDKKMSKVSGDFMCPKCKCTNEIYIECGFLNYFYLKKWQKSDDKYIFLLIGEGYEIWVNHILLRDINYLYEGLDYICDAFGTMNASERAEEEEYWTNRNEKELRNFMFILNRNSAEDCWKKGGSTEKQWIGIKKEWKCWKCKFCSQTFLDFLLKKI